MPFYGCWRRRKSNYSCQNDWWQAPATRLVFICSGCNQIIIEVESWKLNRSQVSTGLKTPRSDVVLSEVDHRSKGCRIFSRVIWLVTLCSSLVVLNGRLLTPTLELPIALVLLAGWITAAWMRFKYSTRKMPPAWHRYLWPLAFPLCAVAFQLGIDPEESKAELYYDVWVVLFIYAVSTIAIALQVRGVVRFARSCGGVFTRSQYRTALRTARVMMWVLPIFFIIAILSEYAFFPYGVDPEKFLVATRNQLFGVIGAASAIAAFTSVPAEALSFRNDFTNKAHRDALVAEISSISQEIGTLRTGIGIINNNLSQIKAQDGSRPIARTFGVTLRALLSSASGRKTRD